VRNALSPRVARVALLVQDPHSMAQLRAELLPLLRAEAAAAGDAAAARKLVPLLFSRQPRQPHYKDLFEVARQLFSSPVAAPGGGRAVAPCMVCNADIYVTATFDLARVNELLPAAPDAAAPGSRVALALTRYESEATLAAPLIDDYRGSHDAFVLRPTAAMLPAAFLAAVDHPQNCYKSENIVLHELRRSGAAVLNPCRSVHTFHHHAADVRQWLPPVDEERYAKAEPQH
jgi:hypothetical protein